MKNKILITGGTGTLGNLILEQLQPLSKHIRAGIHDLKKKHLKSSKHIEQFQFDYRDITTFPEVFKNVKKYVIIAPSGDSYADKTVLPSIRYAINHGVKYLVLISVMGADMSEDMALRKVEQFIINSGISYTIFRPNWFMQNFLTFLKQNIIQKNGIYIPAADAKISFIDARDIAGSVVKALLTSELTNKIITLTGKESLSFFDVALQFSEVLNRNIIYYPLSEDDARRELINAGWPRESTEFMLKLYQNVREGHVSIVLDNISLILRKDPIIFKQFLKDYLCEWKPIQHPECNIFPIHMPYQTM